MKSFAKFLKEEEAIRVGKVKHKDFLSAVRHKGKVYYGDGAHRDILKHVKRKHKLSDDDVDNSIEFGQYRPHMKHFAVYEQKINEISTKRIKQVTNEAWGNIFSRNKESGHLVTGGQGGGGSSPYMRYGSGGGRVRLSQGSTSSGKQKLTTSLIQKLGGGNFMRTRQSFVFGGSSLKKSGLYKTPKFK